MENFNTSYVLVQVDTSIIGDSEIRFQYIICFGSRRLNVYIKEDFDVFQYIICFGSRNPSPVIIFLPL